MRDPRLDIMTTIVSLLEPMSLPVYTTVPNNEANPFIFLGPMNLSQAINKSEFQIIGTIDVELYTGSNSWIGSLLPAYEWLQELKTLLQPNIDFVLPLTDNHMFIWRMNDDSGFTDITETEKLYVATVQYEFELNPDIITKLYYVVHNGVQVTHNGQKVIYHG